ncbi:membrane protein [Cohnella kolymensis]|uniref:membrane protein n=1 Tax=Cohnella kolymensis TaxID=1590652 RepID=UPI00069770A0|nr:membrane protein [Cohnella kolymensis]
MEWEWIPHFASFPVSLTQFMLGVALTGCGIGMYLSIGWGAGPRDGFTLAFAALFRARFGVIRTIIELSVLGAGVWLGGPVFIGTILFSVTIGYFCDIFYFILEKKLMTAFTPDSAGSKKMDVEL